MTNYTLDWDQYTKLARLAAREGVVLLKNEHNTLPLKDGTTISIFGRSQFSYYKSGTGSGGMVNIDYVTSPLDALKSSSDLSITINNTLLQTYEAWIEKNPFDKGEGWAAEPWSQKEMPLDDDVVAQAAKGSDMAIIFIGRTAGEDKDNTADPGSYLLTDIEKDMIRKVSHAFERSLVILNVGNIIDMQWAEEYHPTAILYAWQGGMEGGNGLYDVLVGKVSPSGKLPDTIARSIEDYPSTKNFGDTEKAIYQEDIYVGYRYFETFAKDKVLYPFGFGLSYTNFAVDVAGASELNGVISLSVNVTNKGEYEGKEAVQVYVEKPQGLLGNPVRSLVSFAKTNVLQTGRSETLNFEIPVKDFASYDDGGITGNKSAYVLEAGTYRLHIGTDIRSAVPSFDYYIDSLHVVETLSENMAPVTPFTRMKPSISANGYQLTFEDVPLRTVDVRSRCLEELPGNREYTGDKGYKLADVYNGTVELDMFLDQLTDEDLAIMVRGEGMNSPRVTPGTAGAFGGVSDRLNELGIPAACCADGPSGIRMDCGTKAFSLPNGTLLASTFNVELIEALFEMTGLEMRRNRVDTLLGPGMNIHRNPLNGRNFEYFSEDPYLTGKMAAAQLKGMHRVGVTGTIKHFSANNQEFHRHDIDSIISERALREIYLKGYEIAVKEAGATSIMTTYGAVNGVWTAGLYDQNSRILRGEWGFDGIVMTDWWAKINDEGGLGTKNNTAPMVRSQNDLYMVVNQPDANPFDDNTLAALADGSLTRGELHRNAANICRFIMKMPVMERILGLHDGSIEVIGLQKSEENEFELDVEYQNVANGDSLSLENIEISTGSRHVFAVSLDEAGMYEIKMTGRSYAGELAQMPVTLFQGSTPAATFSFNGTNGEWVSQTKQIFFFNKHAYLKLHFGLGGLELKDIKFDLVNSFSMKD
ncbi:glycoside hydrolase family 3 C-terminal domain-containing protein [Bacillus infantis]|uniref:glycoside hydrolase family 3 protein n=1 Tax=Bacillus infantis TaxID=324767 RepID=UPI001CD805DF|nr:glycoside hydrolase family 3 protein [Bacillus infantis]MCA1036609.1 glycoside hydrolase family 3 C-terminal domain-containing protein [Bacillus infantis]